MAIWPFRRDPVRQFLWRKFLATETSEGEATVSDAMDLQRLHPDLSGPELIRLAYWGASGQKEETGAVSKRELTEEQRASRERWGRVHVEADQRKPFGVVTRRLGQVFGHGTRTERGGYKANNTNG